MTRPALFLDRDGVINADTGYVHRIEEVRFIDGIFDLCREARRLGLALVVVTNQAGIARGFYTEADYQRLSAWMRERFADHGVALDAVYHCPYHPDGHGPYRGTSPLRKPAPGMLFRARDELGLDLGRSVLLGDKESDIAAGQAAGVAATVLFRPDGKRPATRADAVLTSHAGVAAWLAARVLGRATGIAATREAR